MFTRVLYTKIHQGLRHDLQFNSMKGLIVPRDGTAFDDDQLQSRISCLQRGIFGYGINITPRYFNLWAVQNEMMALMNASLELRNAGYELRRTLPQLCSCCTARMVGWIVIGQQHESKSACDALDRSEMEVMWIPTSFSCFENLRHD